MTAFGYSNTSSVRHTGHRVFKVEPQVDAHQPPVTRAGQKTGRGAAVSREVRPGMRLTRPELAAGDRLSWTDGGSCKSESSTRSSACTGVKLRAARLALQMPTVNRKAVECAQAFMARVAQIDVLLCPVCRQGRLHITAVLAG